MVYMQGFLLIILEELFADLYMQTCTNTCKDIHKPSCKKALHEKIGNYSKLLTSSVYIKLVVHRMCILSRKVYMFACKSNGM